MSLAGNTPRSDPDPDAPLSDYLERKVAGVCTRSGCTSMPHGDLQECEPHLMDSRARKRRSDKRRRAALRAKGCCAACGRKSKTYRCRGCREVSADNRPNGADNQHAPRSRPEDRTQAKVETDGRTRYRYIGQAKRGRSSKAEESKRDVREQIKTLERALEALESLDDPQLTKMQRSSKELEIRSLVGLAARFGDEVIERHE